MISSHYNHLLKTGLTAAILTLAVSAHAAEVYFDTISTEKASRMHGAYFGMFGGADISQDADVVNQRGQSFELDNETGWFGGIEFGYQWQTPFPVRPAFEVELFYLYNDFYADGNPSRAVEDDSVRGETHSAVAMANLILALDLSDYRDSVGPFWAGFHPYIGGGIGAAYVWQRNFTFDRGGSVRSSGSNGDVTFAYQLFAGVEFDVSDTLSLYAEYKWLVFDDLGDDTGITNYEHNMFGAGFKVQY